MCLMFYVFYVELVIQINGNGLFNCTQLHLFLKEKLEQPYLHV